MIKRILRYLGLNNNDKFATVDDFMNSLKKTNNWTEQRDYVLDLISCKEYDRIMLIAKKILNTSNSNGANLIYEHIILCLADSKDDVSLQILLQLPLKNMLPQIAGRLVGFRPFRQINDLFQLPSVEIYSLLDLIVQELILRKAKLSDQMINFVTLRNNDYSKLPLVLLSIESQVSRLSYCNLVDSKSRSLGFEGLSFVGANKKKIILNSEKTISYKIKRCKSEKKIIEVINSWVDESNGDYFLKEIEFDKPISSIDSIPFDNILEGTFKNIDLFDQSSLGVFRDLYSAARGGAYSKTRSDSECRLLAWKSLSGFLDLDLDDGCEKIEQKAKLQKWFSFDDTIFFCGVVWDLGIIMLSQDGKRMIIFGATDQD